MRRPDASSHELSGAKLLRDVAARHWGGYGRNRGDAGDPRTWDPVELRAAGAVPSSTEGKGGLLADLQRALPWRGGCPGAVLPGPRRVE